MDKLNELYAYKAKYEKEKLFAEAKISVVEDMIANEEAKSIAIEEEVAYESSPEEETAI